MSKWEGELVLGRVPDGDPRKFRTYGPLMFHSKEGTITVLPGFKTDGATVLRAFWWYVAPFTGKHAAAAVIHDALYKSQLMSREKADKVFYEALIDLKVRKLKAKFMYASVRSFGDLAWVKKEPDASHVRLGVGVLEGAQ